MQRMGSSGSSDHPSERTLVTSVASRALAAPITPLDSCLVVIYGADLGKRIPLGSGAIEAGRSSTCGIPIDQESVSRQHARIFWSDRGYRVRDLGSTNGTFVNDRAVEEQTLVDGDQIKIGRTILKFMTGGNIEASYHEEIYRLMTFDGLTQIYNKRYFHETLEREVSRSRRYGRALSLVLFDIDLFKQINDTHGHLAGDAVLRELATTVKNKIRRQDVLARVGGEEFAVLGPEVDLVHMREAAEKIRALVEATPFRFEKKALPTTVSLGVSSWQKDDTPELIYKRADDALYVAKQGGRNRVV